MSDKLEVLKSMLGEYGDVKLSKVIKELEALQVKPTSLKEIGIKGERYHGRGCYECAGEHGSIYPKNVFHFLTYELDYFCEKGKEGCDIPKTVADEFASMLLGGYLGDDYFTSYSFDLSHDLTVEEISEMIVNELWMDEDEVEEIERKGFDDWYEAKYSW